MGHLDALRWTILRCLCAIIICAIPCGIFWQTIFKYFALWPLHLSDPVPQLIFTMPTDTIYFIFKMALVCGAVAASPFLFHQIWRFIAPALYKNEKKAILSVVIASTVCFLSGIAFCYFFLPLFLRFLIGFAGGLIDPLFRINDYFGFLVKMCLIFGLVFELPVISYILSKLGIINHRFLIRYFRHAIVIIFIAAAILTPPDVLSQVLMALPLTAFYAISILISFLTRPSPRKQMP